jgi:hypothetical protein
MSTISERVRAGVELLDKSQPQWREKVNPVRLDMTLQGTCILGQVYGWYTEGLKQIGLLKRSYRDLESEQAAAAHGFTAVQGLGTQAADDEFRLLKEEWLSAIE